ncbi:hypothetical protein, partial [Rhizobium leguminosarum]|uniref:hypothetical protein n=1 Tax=Rhizobium leguminosarum TaxID=384 RepID=UPI001C90AF4C
QTDQPYREFLTFIHNLVSTSFKWTPHAKAHSNTEGAEKFALTLKLTSWTIRQSGTFRRDHGDLKNDKPLRLKTLTPLWSALSR